MCPIGQTGMRSLRRASGGARRLARAGRDAHALLLALLALAVGAVGRAGAQDLSARADAYLRARTPAPFSGVVLIARGDRVLFERAYGLADADLGVPNAPGLRFNIGSLTKPITAAAVLRLAQGGRLALEDSLCRFLFACPAAWRPVTLRHLLSHASGIPDLFGELPAAPADSLRAVVDAAARRHAADTLRHAPGARYAYSNFNYILLGYVLEAAGGAPWPSVLRREVFAPAGMADTEYDDVWRILPGRVRGYTLAGGKLRHVAYHDHGAYTAGGLLSSARDLLRLDRALSGGRLLADSLLRAMTTPGLGDYALGWQVIRAFGRTLRNHTGGTTGFASHLAHYDDGTTVIILSNVEEEPAKATACDLAAITFGLRPSPRAAGVSACRPLP
jgi:CubicO group peptidase (beta-lactamase class C family)